MVTRTEGRTLKIIFLSAVLFVSLGLLAYLTTNTAQTVDIQQWTSARAYPFDVASRSALVHGDFIYVFGGRVGVADLNVRTATNAVKMAEINPDGSLGPWTSTSALPHTIYNHAVAADDEHVYLVGGWDTTADSILREVWRAPFQQNGGLGSWQRLQDFPASDLQGIDLHAVEVVGDRLYVIGGWNGKNALKQVRYAPILSNGIGKWTKAPNDLPNPIARADSAQFDDHVYIVGGGYRVDNGPDEQSAEVYYSKVNTDNSLGPWQKTTSLPNPVYYHQAVIHDGRLVVLGGRDNTQTTDRVWSSEIQNDGRLGSWNSEPRLPEAVYRHAAVSLRRFGSDYIYTVGGWGTDNTFRDAVYHSAAPPIYTPTPTPGIEARMVNAPNYWLAPGDEVTYEISLTGNNVEDFEDVRLTGEIPDETELVPDSVTDGNSDDVTIRGTTSGSTIEWRWPQFSKDEGDAVSYRVRRLPPPTPDVPVAFSIDKRGPATASAGEPIEYTLTVVNKTPIAIDDVWIEDVMPVDATYVSGGDGPPEAGIVKWTVPTFAPNESREFKFVVTADRTLVNSLYRVRSADGANIRGQTVVVTVVDDTPPPPSGDGVAITNAGADIRWTIGGQDGTGKSNPVRNPIYVQFLPMVEGR